MVIFRPVKRVANSFLMNEELDPLIQIWGISFRSYVFLMKETQSLQFWISSIKRYFTGAISRNAETISLSVYFFRISSSKLM